jgi:hypothetical protein
MTKCILWTPNIDISKEWQSLDMAVLVHCVVGHVHVALSNGLTFDTAEVDRFFLWVVLHDIDDREPILNSEVGIGTFPNGTSSRRTIYMSIPMPGSWEPWPVKT